MKGILQLGPVLNGSQEVLHQVDHAGTADRFLSLRFRVLGVFRVSEVQGLQAYAYVGCVEWAHYID